MSLPLLPELPDLLYNEDELLLDESPLDDSPPSAELPKEDPAYPAFALFQQLNQEKRELELKKEQNDRALARVLPHLLRYFEMHPGFTNVGMPGLTVYKKTELWARAKQGSNRQAVCDALRADGWGHFVKDDFSVQSLSKHVRDLEKLHAEELESGAVPDTSALLPPKIAAVLNVESSIKIIGMRRSKST